MLLIANQQLFEVPKCPRHFARGTGRQEKQVNEKQIECLR